MRRQVPAGGVSARTRSLTVPAGFQNIVQWFAIVTPPGCVPSSMDIHASPASDHFEYQRGEA
jgi:hypothetical protein